MSKSIHYEHEEVVYVPCYQENNTFVYSMADATHDEQLAHSMEPDYVLILKGKFDAKTQPFDEEIAQYNVGVRKVDTENNS